MGTRSKAWEAGLGEADLWGGLPIPRIRLQGKFLQGREPSCPTTLVTCHFASTALRSLNFSGVVCQAPSGSDSSPRGMHTNNRKAGSEASWRLWAQPGDSWPQSARRQVPLAGWGGDTVPTQCAQRWQLRLPRPAPPWALKEPERDERDAER